MSIRALVVAGFLLGVVALAPRTADACCLGCACTKYKTRYVTYRDPATGYTHSAAGAVPKKFSIETIGAFLVRGTWKPFPPPPPPKPPKTGAKQPPQKAPREGGTVTSHVPPSAIRFVPADQITDAIQKDATAKRIEIVLIRRIEQQGKSILVELNDGLLWRLAPCPRKAGTACLLLPDGTTPAARLVDDSATHVDPIDDDVKKRPRY